MTQASTKLRPGRGAGCRTVEVAAGRRAPREGPGGFSLIEVLVGLVITVIAVVGLAHLFGNGRGLIDHYEVARAATGAVQQRFDLLRGAGTASDLSVGSHPSTPNPWAYEGATIGTERWTVAWYDDPIDGTGVGDSNPNDLKLVTVIVKWGQGTNADSVRVSRLFASTP